MTPPLSPTIPGQPRPTTHSDVPRDVLTPPRSDRARMNVLIGLSIVNLVLLLLTMSFAGYVFYVVHSVVDALSGLTVPTVPTDY